MDCEDGLPRRSDQRVSARGRLFSYWARSRARLHRGHSRETEKQQEKDSDSGCLRRQRSRLDGPLCDVADRGSALRPRATGLLVVADIDAELAERLGAVFLVIGGAAADSLGGDGNGFVVGTAGLEDFNHLV